MEKKKKLRHSLLMGHLRIFIFFFFVYEMALFSKPLDLQIETPHAILINAQTGKVLFDKRGRESVYPGSTTKIATAVYLLKHAEHKLDELVVCSEEALRVVSEEEKAEKGPLLPAHILELDGTTYNLKRKERLSLRELLYSAMIASANDSTNVIAEYLCGDIQVFVCKLNEMMMELGCKNTHFCNPHGLFHADHKTTPLDMAILAKEALKYPLFREIVKMPSYNRSKLNGNHLIRPDSKNFYQLAQGIKTGYTKKAKYNLVALASNGERELIAALHKSPTSNQRFEDAILLFEAAFSEPLQKRLLLSSSETFYEKEISKANKALVAILEEDLYLQFYPSEEEDIVAKLSWDNLKLPIQEGAPVGQIKIFSKEDQRLLLTQNLVARDRVVLKFQYVILDLAKILFMPIILPFFLIAGAASLALILRRKFTNS
jgi:D-alanyl-D-alanine carboxypeptidase (penicillin-binding protein 5/6)